MKKLDEVIKAMESCNCHDFVCHQCPYYDDDDEVGCRSDDKDEDAFHYLKEYQKLINKYHVNISNIQERQVAKVDSLILTSMPPQKVYKCGNCWNEVKTQDVYCSRCGAKLEWKW